MLDIVWGLLRVCAHLRLTRKLFYAFEILIETFDPLKMDDGRRKSHSHWSNVTFELTVPKRISDSNVTSMCDVYQRLYFQSIFLPLLRMTIIRYSFVFYRQRFDPEIPCLAGGLLGFSPKGEIQLNTNTILLSMLMHNVQNPRRPISRIYPKFI